jgi:protein MpaA
MSWKNAILAWTKTHPVYIKRAVMAGIVCVSLFVIYSIAWPQTIAYNYGAARSCVVAPKFIPQLFSVHDTGTTYDLERTKTIRVGKFVVYSHSICATAQQAPQSNGSVRYHESFVLLALAGKQIHVTTTAHPHTSLPAQKSAIAVTKPLVLTLDKPDTLFTYRLSVDGKQQACKAQHTKVSCNLAPLQLKHAAAYKATLHRYFRGAQSGVVSQSTITTLTPITIITSSLQPGAVVYDKPASITLQTDKTISALGAATLTTTNPDKTTKTVELQAAYEKSTVTIALPELARKMAYSLKIASMEAADQSGLPGGSYSLAFSTSGGPIVTQASIGKNRAPAHASITITLDQPLHPQQDFTNLFGIYVGNTRQAATVSANGNRLSIRPTQALAACTSFTLKTTTDIASEHGITGDSGWSFQSRTLCGIPFTVGSSVKGRAITGYKFGSQANPVVYIGALHGNELSSKILLDRWLTELENNPSKLPSDRSVVVIPNANPDGVVANSRLNSSGVDLNRNFPANDWKSSITIPGGQLLPTGGGTNALSEPESKAVANYVSSVQPRLLLSYHAVASIIEANEAGNSLEQAAKYAQLTRYRNVPRSGSTAFAHDTTGALEDWMRDKLGLPALVVELGTRSGNEFERNKPALWAMLE